MGGQLELVWHGQDGDSILAFAGGAQVEHVEDHLVPGQVSGEGAPCELPAGQPAGVARAELVFTRLVKMTDIISICCHDHHQ